MTDQNNDTPTPQHKPGDVVNGHILTEANTWEPYTPEPEDAPRRKRKAWPWIVGGAVVFLLLFVVVIGSVASVAKNVAAVGDKEPVATAAAKEIEEPPAEPAKPKVQPLAISESAFGLKSESDRWWYAVTVENPNTDYVFQSGGFTIEAVDANGVILDSSSDYTTLLQGKTVLTGSFFEIGTGQIAKIDVRGPVEAAASYSPAAETGSFAISNIATAEEYGYTDVTGQVSSTFSTDQEYVTISVIARDPNGTIIGSDSAHVKRLPAGGAAQFTSNSWKDVQPGTTFEAYAML